MCCWPKLGTTQPARGHTGVEQARPLSRGYVRSKCRTQAQCKRFLSRSCSVHVQKHFLQPAR